jgi:hypothetical protein
MDTLFSTASSVLIVLKRTCAVTPLLLLLTCDPNSAPEPPEFSDLTLLGGKRFVAYVSPDRGSKPDTVAVSCTFSGMAFHSIEAAVTVDSGVSWITIPESMRRDGNRVILRWVPGDDSVNFSYFGEKGCRIRISDTASTEFIESDPFVIIGPQPLILLSPHGGETFSLNDTIAVNYQTNSDRISNIRVFFINNIVDDWIELKNTKLIDYTSPPIRSYKTFFVPLDYESVFGYYVVSPVRFLLKDYGVNALPNSTIVSGDISLEL